MNLSFRSHKIAVDGTATRYLMIFDGGVCAASLEIQVANHQASVRRLYVSDEYRRKGFATQLLEKAESFSKSKKCLSLGLLVQLVNKGAINLYLSAGYTVGALFKNEHGQWTMEMWKNISPGFAVNLKPQTPNTETE